MRRLLAVGVLVGCYSPTPPAGAPCVDGLCPSGLVCSPATYTCEKSAVDPDAPPGTDDAPALDDAATDAALDGQTSPYLYRRRITIQNTSASTLAAGYTIRVPFTMLSTLVGAGKVKADFSDLRIIGDSSLGERNRIVDAAPAPVAINFSLTHSIAGNTTNQSYYIYYGRPNATAAPANGAQVFAVYDDFATAIGNFWLINDAPAVTGGRLILRANHTDAITTNASTDGVPIVSAIELVAGISNPTSDPTVQPTGTFYYWFGYQRTGDFSAVDPWAVWIARGKGQVHAEQKSPTGCEGSCEGLYTAQNTSPRYYAIERDTSATRFYIDGALQYTATVNNTADYSLMVRNFQAAGEVQVDWIRGRIRVSPDPTITVGAEEDL